MTIEERIEARVEQCVRQILESGLTTREVLKFALEDAIEDGRKVGAEAEREECAKIAEGRVALLAGIAKGCGRLNSNEELSILKQSTEAKLIAKRIRARSEGKGEK